MDFQDIVVYYRCTCEGCPTQYEGTLKDGRSFYFRYRFNFAYLGIGPSARDAVKDQVYAPGIPYGDYDLQGIITEDEFKTLFMQLWGSQHRRLRLGRGDDDLIKVPRSDLLELWAMSAAEYSLIEYTSLANDDDQELLQRIGALLGNPCPQCLTINGDHKMDCSNG